ncbi:hypothetical protein OKA05_09545 [Luteolibacter arcticus]|uniref:Organic solvent tolerance-like N-terminal domain-containing protein n=1 Tax=Luteolibacter arcticus TaxID=1581411 RepID=A0ABT3GGQ6_9BACT|nr:hypothetical protein [Luteolibacter arcticus]MCW1922793.1 hypothetical protein [Luteolibacter arcticus]
MPLRPLRSKFSLPGPLVVSLMGAALGLAVATAQTTVPERVPQTDGEESADESGGLFSGGLLPNGSILKNVVLPSYDLKNNQTSSVNAGDLTIFTREESRMDAKTGKPKTVAVLDKVKINDLRIRFFNPDRTLKGNIAMSRALLEIRKKISLLTSEEPVSFVSDDLKVDGSALAFDTKNNRGFLHGPVTAVAKTTDKRTSMNASPAQRALAAGAMMMAAATAQEAAPAQPATTPAAPAATTTERFARARLSQVELDQLAAEKASRASQHDAGTKAADEELGAVKAKSEDARITMNSFLQAASLASVMAAPTPGVLPDVPRPPALDDPNDTVVKSKDGAYFDSEEGLLIFLGDVTVKNPELDLSGASEVKIFMEPQKDEKTASVDPNAPPKEVTPEMLEKMAAAKAAKDAQQTTPTPQPTEKKPGDPAAEKPLDPATQLTPEQLEKMKATKGQKTAPTPEQLEKVKAAQLAAGLDAGGKGGKFGDIKRMVATGPAVRIRYKSGREGDAPVEASAHTVVYDFEKHQILLQGGSPWVYQEGEDGMRGQAHGPNAYILVYTDDDGNLTKVLFENQGGHSTFNVKTPEKDDPKKNQKPKQDKPKQVQPNR